MQYPPKGLSWLLSTSMMISSLTVLGGPGLAATGISSPESRAIQNSPAPLIASLRLRLGVRPSRYRLGGFRRANSCIKREEGKIAPIEPPLRPEELDSDLSETEQGAINIAQTGHPTFFTYVPELDDEFEGITQFHGIFTLTEVTNSGETQIYQTRFPLDKAGGIVGVQLPTSEAPLEMEKSYVWMFVLECSVEKPDSNPLFESWVQRTNLATTAPADKADAVAFYAENGIWQDAVGLLGKARYTNSHDTEANQLWQQLMEAADLSEFATTPVVQMR
jgi:hypothetical protein